MPDAQVTVADSAAVVAVVHSLAAWLAERHEPASAQPPAPTWRIEENRWQALRHGLDGTLADLRTGDTMPARERLHALLDELDTHAAASSAARRSSSTPARSSRANGADRQREAARERRHARSDRVAGCRIRAAPKRATVTRMRY